MFSIMHCITQGHELVALGNLYPAQEEVDSWMFQSVAHSLLPMLAEAIGVKLYRKPLLGKSLQTGAVYEEDVGDEVEDLFQLISQVKQEQPDLEAVCSGAILSSYQRIRVEHVCSRLGLTSIAPLWMQNQAALIQDMISMGLESVLVKVAAVGLDESHLLQSLAQVHPVLVKLNKLYDLHICGEGGEYETITLDAPFFKKKIQILESDVILHSEGVHYIIIKKAVFLEKSGRNDSWIEEMRKLIFTQERYALIQPISSSQERGSYTTKECIQVSAKITKRINGPFFAISGISTSVSEMELAIENVLHTIQSVLYSLEFTWKNVLQV